MLDKTLGLIFSNKGCRILSFIVESPCTRLYHQLWIILYCTAKQVQSKQIALINDYRIDSFVETQNTLDSFIYLFTRVCVSNIIIPLLTTVYTTNYYNLICVNWLAIGIISKRDYFLMIFFEILYFIVRTDRD